MKAFAIESGDLVVGPEGFATVSGSTKVQQDLGIAMREPLGCDRFHPRWGTTLTSMVGGVITNQTEMLVRSEVQRLIKNYVAVQGQVVEQDVALAQRSRIATSEVITAVEGIDIRQDFDRVHVRVRLRVFSGETVTLSGTVS